MSASRAKPGLAASVWKVGAGTLSTAAALVSILSYTNSAKGFIGSPKKPLVASAPETRWVGLAPSADTMTALGDSLQLAVTATDERGAAQAGITPAWTSTEDGVASVDQGGRVVARGPGMTTIVVSVGRVSARSRITVRQTPAGVRLSDTLIRIPEGEHVRPLARVVDARGGPIAGTAVSWRTSDAVVVAMDSLGQATGMSPGEGGVRGVTSRASGRGGRGAGLGDSRGWRGSAGFRWPSALDAGHGSDRIPQRQVGARSAGRVPDSRWRRG
jgi:hypothetical protein